MKYFIDTEFIEGFHKPLFGKERHFIDLISIGIVAEDGREYSAISSEYNKSDASQWVNDNVIIPLYVSTVHGDARNLETAEKFHKHYGKPNYQIAKEIIEFIYSGEDVYSKIDIFGSLRPEKINGTIEFYGYYSDYDWVLFCSLFGTMMDLPKGFPMYCRDLKQMLDDSVTQWMVYGNTRDLIVGLFDDELEKVKNLPFYPKQQKAHDALADAMWNKELHKFIVCGLENQGSDDERSVATKLNSIKKAK